MINSEDSFGGTDVGMLCPIHLSASPLDPVPSFHTLVYNMDFCTET